MQVVSYLVYSALFWFYEGGGGGVEGSFFEEEANFVAGG